MKKSLILFFVLLCTMLSVMSVSAAPLGANPGTSELPLLPPTPVTNAQCDRNDSNCKAKCEAWWANMNCGDIRKNAVVNFGTSECFCACECATEIQKFEKS